MKQVSPNRVKFRKGAVLLVAFNWGMSLLVVGSVDTERSSFPAVLAVFGWFVLSSVLLLVVQNRCD
jgi:hypothetical protein